MEPSILHRVDVDERALNDWLARNKGEPALHGFGLWMARAFRRDGTATEEQGIVLAKKRRDRLSELIQTDPRHAIELALPQEWISELPPRVAALVEQHVTGRGRLSVLGALPENARNEKFVGTFRVATLGKTKYEAFVYGRRLGQPTRDNIPMHGVAVASAEGRHLLAVHESPARLLSRQEAVRLKKGNAVDPICSISGLASTAKGDETALGTDGQVIFTCGLDHALILQKQIAAADGQKVLLGEAEGPLASPYTEGQKRLLFIRIDFPDLPGPPFADADGAQLLTNINRYWVDTSYGKLSVAMPGQSPGQRSDVTPTFRLPNPAEYYATNNRYDELRADARAAADAAGFYRTNYDFDVTCLGFVPGLNWRGLGYVGASGAWIRNSFFFGTFVHELGHNLGLNHASFWDTGNRSAIGPGTQIEYGDSFDAMGSDNGAGPYNARYRAYLNWIATNDVVTFTTNGVYRIMAYDVTNSTGIRALKIIRNEGSESTNHYWLEYHAMQQATEWQRAGAQLRWAGEGNQNTLLIDTTPGSPPGLLDVPIAIGRTFVDEAFGIYVTPLRRVATTPESLEIFVFQGATASNLAPTLSISATTTNTALNSPVDFIATASDPNGDELAYHWDFGDGSFGTNGNTITKMWSTPGEYVVLCTVTDMRGGEARRRAIVRVGSPATYRISGKVLNDGNPVQGVRVAASSTRVTYTDSNGDYDLVNLGAGSYTVQAVLQGYAFTNIHFANPVTVGPDAQSVDFISDPPRYVLPTVAISNPLQGAMADEGTNILISATASVTGGRSITNVEFFAGTFKLGEAATAPYVMTWTNAIFGTYSLTARTVDNFGVAATSAPVSIAISRTLLRRGSVWKYLDDGSDQGTAWAAPDFNDTSWASGPARLGYGGDGEVTTVSYGANPAAKHITTYFRRDFESGRGVTISNLIARLSCDDGAIVYMDGQEAFRHNVTDNAVTFTTPALRETAGAYETGFLEITLPANQITASSGTHLLAAEVHQISPNSEDLGFDLELVVIGNFIPALAAQRVGNQLQLSWVGLPGEWELYRTAGVTSGIAWLPVMSPINAVNGTNTAMVSMPAVTEFYRLGRP